MNSDRTTTAWGYGFYGQTNVPTGLTDCAAVAGGYFHSLALFGETQTVSNLTALDPTWSNSTFTLSTPTTFGRSYQLMRKTSLADQQWLVLPPTPGDGTIRLLRDSSAISSQGFYKIWQKP